MSCLFDYTNIGPFRVRLAARGGFEVVYVVFCKFYNGLLGTPISGYCFRNPLMGSRSSLIRFRLAP